MFVSDNAHATDLNASELHRRPEKNRFRRLASAAVFALALTVMLTPNAADAQLSSAWMVPASAHTAGIGGTFWRTDLSIHNPQPASLSVVVQVLETGIDNSSVPTLDLEIAAWETVNLWDVLGPDLFNLDASAAILVYVPAGISCSNGSCDFLVTSRSYTQDPQGNGEFGQAVSGATILEGTDWLTLGYAAGILNDGEAFRCNIGVASWTPDWVQVQVDVQDASGTIIDTEVFDLPPFGHLQRRLREPVVGGSLVFYLTDGPNDSWVYPYASVVDQDTGDPAYFFARYSGVGVTKRAAGRRQPIFPQRSTTIQISERKLSR